MRSSAAGHCKDPGKPRQDLDGSGFTADETVQAACLVTAAAARCLATSPLSRLVQQAAHPRRSQGERKAAGRGFGRGTVVADGPILPSRTAIARLNRRQKARQTWLLNEEIR